MNSRKAPPVFLNFDSLAFLLHDTYFELDAIRFDPVAKSVAITFHYGRDKPKGHASLEVTSVVDYQVEDRSQIGLYSVNTIRMEHPALVLQANEDLRLIMRLEDESSLQFTMHQP
jgi:hypothetical protein